MLILTKRITRRFIQLFYFLIIVFSLTFFYYIADGHTRYSILEKYQDVIIYNIKKQYNIQLTYQTLEEDWHYFIPNIDMKKVVVIDSNGNQFNSDNVVLRVDILNSLIYGKLKVKKINFNNSTLNYKYEKNGDTDLDIENFISINEIKINNLNLNINYNNKDYSLKNINVKYNKNENFVNATYNDLILKQYFLADGFYRTEIEGDSEKFTEVIKNFISKEALNNMGYNVVNIFGNLKVVLNFNTIDDYNIIITLKNNIVNLISQNLKFEKFSGNIYYDNTDKKIYSEVMSCQTNKKPCTFQIKNNGKDIRLNFNAYANNNTLQNYVPFIDNTSFSGNTLISGYYNIFGSNSLTIKSNLEGLVVDNIPFLSKLKEEKINLVINMYEKNDISNLKIVIGGIQIIIDLNKDFKAEVYFNEEVKSIKEKLTRDENLYISGEVDNLDVESLINFIKNLKIKDNNNKNFNYKASLLLTKPNYLGINPELVKYSDNNGDVNMVVIDNYISGSVNYKVKSNELNLDIDKFHYQTLKSNITKENILKIKDFPSIIGNIKDLDYDGYKGMLSFNSYHSADNYMIDNIEGELNNIKPNFTIKISQDKEFEITTALENINNEPLIKFNNISSILKSYGYSDTIKSSTGEVYGNLLWKGLFPNIKTLNGHINFKFEDGKINTISKGNRVLKIFKILEFNMISEFFKLDFDFLSKGIKYDSIIGGGFFINGVYLIDKNIEINSSNYNSKISGNIDLLNERFENKIIIDLPISQKLPTIALLTGNPVAIAGVWLTDKLIGDKINSLTSLSFSVKGSFDDPNISR